MCFCLKFPKTNLLKFILNLHLKTEKKTSPEFSSLLAKSGPIYLLKTLKANWIFTSASPLPPNFCLKKNDASTFSSPKSPTLLFSSLHIFQKIVNLLRMSGWISPTPKKQPSTNGKLVGFGFLGSYERDWDSNPKPPGPKPPIYY